MKEALHDHPQRVSPLEGHSSEPIDGLSSARQDDMILSSDPSPLRTRSQVLKLRDDAISGGCCAKFADQMPCDCLEKALPDQLSLSFCTMCGKEEVPVHGLLCQGCLNTVRTAKPPDLTCQWCCKTPKLPGLLLCQSCLDKSLAGKTLPNEGLHPVPSSPQRKDDGHVDLSLATFPYRNHKGEEAIRRVLPIKQWFGVTAWHRQAQWFLKAFDLDRQAMRDFAMSGILGPWKRLADGGKDVPL